MGDDLIKAILGSETGFHRPRVVREDKMDQPCSRRVEVEYTKSMDDEELIAIGLISRIMSDDRLDVLERGRIAAYVLDRWGIK